MSQTSGALAQPSSRDWLPLLVGAFGGGLAALSLAVAGPEGLASGGLLLAFALAVAVIAARPIALLLAFVALLPLHLLSLVLLFNAGVDHDVIRAFSTWKEALALALLAVLVLQNVLAGRLSRPRALDLAVLSFVALNVLYAVAPVMSPIDVPLGARLQGLRDNAFFAVLYFIGRLAPLTARQVRLFASVAIGVGVAGALAGIFERLVLPIDFFFDPLRFDYFYRDYLNLHYYTGIPYNFWTSVGTVRRGVSFYLGSHHFAMASALLIPLILALRRPARPFPAALRTPLLLLAVIGLALPLTRSVVLACLLQVLLIGWLTRRHHYTLVAALSVMLLLGSSFLFLDLSGYVRNVATDQYSSTASHLASWQDTRDIVRNYPLGLGFGVADTVAERSTGEGAGVLGGEGEYAFVVTSVGIPGLMLFVSMIGAAALTLLHAWKRASGPTFRQLALIGLALLVAYAVVGVFTQVRHVPAFLFPLWWLIGSVASGPIEGDRHPTA